VLEREGGLVVEHRGDLRMDGALLSWYTAQPDPSHWIAVGSTSGPAAEVAMHLLVGVGHTEAEATAELLRSALSARVVPDPQAGEDDSWVAEWSL
jgi:hypothetical protein